MRGRGAVDRRLGEAPGWVDPDKLPCFLYYSCPLSLSLSVFLLCALFLPFPSRATQACIRVSVYIRSICINALGSRELRHDLVCITMPSVCVNPHHDLVCITMPLVCANPHHDLVCITMPLVCVKLRHGLGCTNVLSLGCIGAFSLPVSS